MREFIVGQTKMLDVDFKTVTDMVVKNDEKQVGELKISVEKDTCSVLYVAIKREFRRQGYATKIIEQLNEQYTIVGDCLPNEDSIGFWQSVGAEFDEDISVEECVKYGACIPFLVY